MIVSTEAIDFLVSAFGMALALGLLVQLSKGTTR